jgi:hypothetical protein
MLGWLRNRISVRTGRVTLPTFTWVAEEPAQPIPLGPDDQCVKATKELIIAAVKSLDPVRQLIRADAILKASV